VLEDFTEIAEMTHNNKSLLVMNTDPSTLPVLKSPREWGADIACGEAQSLGIPLSVGGPYLGFLATITPLLRKMPGRICGITNDVDDKRGFVLTLQAREQHIRREKANSNICSNQSLMALSVAIYMSLLGKTGMKEVAMRAYNNAHYFYDQLLLTGLFKKVSEKPFFKEFVLEFNGKTAELNEFLLKENILGGFAIDNNKMLLCATEVRTKKEIDEFVRLVGEINVR
jgi:glycine dehydrogenase subunit 1